MSYVALTANYSTTAIRDNIIHYAFHGPTDITHADNRCLKDVLYNLYHINDYRASDVMDDKDTLSDTMDIIDILSPRQRDAINHHIIDGLTLDDAAKKMHCTAANVHYLIRRALIALAGLYGEDISS